MNLLSLLRPSVPKLALALVLFAVFQSTHIQAYAFAQSGAKPRLYDLLSPLALWPASVLLFGPIHWLSSVFHALRPAGLGYHVAGALFSVGLAWLGVFAHERGGVRIYRPGRFAWPLAPVALFFVLAHTWPESESLSGLSLAISGVIFAGVVVAGYAYLVFCLTRGLRRSAWWTARSSRAGT